MRKFQIKLQQRPDSPLQISYIVSEKGFVGRQKVWRGRPLKLLGFNSHPGAGDIDIAVFINKEVIPHEDMMLGIGRYPVFIDSNENWFTMGIPVESIKEIRK